MIGVIVIAAGAGSRMGVNVPRQFVLADGKPMLFRAFEAFERYPLVDAVGLMCL